MKRFLSISLALILIVTSVPIAAFAAEPENTEYDEMMELASNVFPEYASLISGSENIPATFSLNTEEEYIVDNETRHISDTESVTLSITRSGDVIVINNMNTSTLDLTYFDNATNSIGSVGVTGKTSFRVAWKSNYGLSYELYFKLTDVEYTIYYTGSDYFTNLGTPSGTVYEAEYQENEATETTAITYYLYLRSGGQAHYFQLYFNDDKLVAKAG